jgi:hypothetical protein
LDLTRTDHEQEIKVFDLDIVLLNLEHGDNAYKKMVKLTDFLEMVEAVKVAINHALYGQLSGDLVSFPSLVANILRCVIYFLNIGIYKLSDVSRQDAETLFTKLCHGGWWLALPYRKSFLKLLRQCRTDIAVLGQVIGGAKNSGKRLFMSDKAVQDLIGLPLASSQIPMRFVRCIERLSNKQSERKKDNLPRASKSSAMQALTALNLLAAHKTGCDTIPFLPFPSPSGSVAAFFGSTDERSRNLDLADATAIFKECVHIVYDLGPRVIAMCLMARDLWRKEWLEYKGPYSHTAQDAFRNGLAAILRILEADFDDSYDLSDYKHGSAGRLKKMVALVQCATVTLITFLQARRLNEVVGEGKAKFGLYFGCVTTVSEALNEKELDIYLVKNIKQFVTMWCNNMVSDCVQVLEGLANAHRPPNTEPLKRAENIDEARLQKLLVLRLFHAHGLGDKEQFHYDRVKVWLLQRAGVAPEKLDGPRAFRRLFGLIFTNRFDNPLILALQEQYGHLSVWSTYWYCSDSKSKDWHTRQQKMYAERLLLEEEFDEVRSENFERKILDMLDGKSVGGIFPRLVARTAKHLSSRIEFVMLDNVEKAKALHAACSERGYKNVERKDNSCTLGSARTARFSKCKKDGKPRPELASYKTCDDCIHGLGNNESESIHQKELDEVQAKADDYRLPLAVRLECAEKRNELQRLIASERTSRERNRSEFKKLAESWAPIVLDRSNLRRSTS